MKHLQHVEPKKRSTFSQQLVKIRKKHRLTQAELAERMNLDRNRISYYEVKATNPTIDSIQPLADFFNVPVEYFFGKKDQQKPRGPSSQLDKRLVQLKKLTRSQQQTVIAMLDGLLFQLSESQT